MKTIKTLRRLRAEIVDLIVVVERRMPLAGDGDPWRDGDHETYGKIQAYRHTLGIIDQYISDAQEDRKEKARRRSVE